MAWGVGRWTCNPDVPCHQMDLSSVVPNSTPPRFVNDQLVSLPFVIFVCLFTVSTISTTVLNNLTLQ